MNHREWIHTSFDVMNQWEAVAGELEAISESNNRCFLFTALEIWIEENGFDRSEYADLYQYILQRDGRSDRTLTVLHHRPPLRAGEVSTDPWEDDVSF